MFLFAFKSNVSKSFCTKSPPASSIIIYYTDIKLPAYTWCFLIEIKLKIICSESAVESITIVFKGLYILFRESDNVDTLIEK